ncbi:MAG: bifunctional folylpolyglutamate synthase/dihydrofolate synthase, partial [Hungatella sp.]
MDNIEEYLNQIPMWAAKKNTLEDIREYLKVLGNPDESMKMIHVAGTNGKGSVCAFLTSVLTEAGYKVGTFISPHLVDT